MAGDAVQTLRGLRRGRFEGTLTGDVGLGAEHAPWLPVEIALDDAPTLVYPAPAAVRIEGAVHVLVGVDLAALVPQVSGVVGLALIRMDQRGPVFLGVGALFLGVAEHRKTLGDVGQAVAFDVPLPDKGAGAAQCRAHGFPFTVGDGIGAAGGVRNQGCGALDQRLEIGHRIGGAPLQAEHADAL